MCFFKNVYLYTYALKSPKLLMTEEVTRIPYPPYFYLLTAKVLYECGQFTNPPPHKVLYI